MTGPIAPRDPSEKRAGFYVLLDKQVGGIPQDDGRGRHSIFISSDRLPSFARVTGGIQDQAILDLLTDVKGFRKLVHSLGVTVSGKAGMEVTFSLMCKGSGGPGSCHSFTFPADGAERVITLEALTWSEFDAGLGEFRFEMPGVSDMATVSVKCYVNDGFVIPEQDPDPAVDTGSWQYREMIARSFLSAGNNQRIKNFLRRLRAGEEVTLAFLGGSITQGAGAVPLQENCYARLAWQGLTERYGNSIRYIKAGLGGTPSETGLVRYDRDITRDGQVQPDLVVVEFAVNDSGDETEGVFYESLVRKILNAPNRPAVILLFAVFANDWNLKRRLAPIGYRYQLPMVDVLEAVSAQFEAKDRVITKRQYFYDVYHPSNLGHRIMADCLLYLVDRLDRQQPEAENEDFVPPYYGRDYETLRLADRKDGLPDCRFTPGSFTDTDTELQAVPLDFDSRNTPMFPYNWKKGKGNDPFVAEITCRKLVLEFKDSGDPAFGKALVTIDGEKSRVLDPLEAGWTHCHTALLFNRQEAAPHRVEIAMAPGEEGKTFTILGFGVVR